MPMALRPASNSWGKKRKELSMRVLYHKFQQALNPTRCVARAQIWIPHDRRSRSALASTNWHTASPVHPEKLWQGKRIWGLDTPRQMSNVAENVADVQ
jgi:hypothetical protein